MTLLDVALQAHAAGLCCIPAMEDGSKRPFGEWLQYKTERPDEQTLKTWFSNGRTGLGLVCGQVSGNLEMFEFEGRAVDEGLLDRFDERANRVGLGDLIGRLQDCYYEFTPSGGIHLLYRCPEGIAGNLKLARRPSTDDEIAFNPNDRLKVLIETRGEGGYTIIAPSSGGVHPSGLPWKLAAGGIATIPTITADERDALHELARSFDEMPVAERPAPRPVAPRRPGDDVRPGDDFNTSADWGADVLAPSGWVESSTHGDETYWRRPGKTTGISATTNYQGAGLLKVFSTSTEFDTDSSYSKFGAYAQIHHGGDHPAAARDLGRRGYGSQRPTTRQSAARASGDSSPAELRAAEGAAAHNADSPASDTEGPPEPRITMRLWSAKQLADADRSFTWCVKGMLSHPTYGQIAGDKKTLKSYIGTFIDVGIASGLPIFDHFQVDRSGPVVVYVGEGGRIPYTNRLERVAKAMGAGLDSLDMHVSFDVARIGSAVFTDSLHDHLDAYRPALVHLDPLYAFHPDSKDARNLFESGSMLTSMSAPCMDAGANLLIANHWNKTGTGKGLDRITQSGSAEWCDTWLLVSHREQADVENGQFKLLLEIGSRQWGGNSWDLDLDVGRFDIDTGEYDGAITWDLHHHVAAPANLATDKTAERILEVVTDRPWQVTKVGLFDLVKGNRAHFDHVLDALIDSDQVTVQPVPRQENGRTMTRKLYGPASQHEPRHGQGWSRSEHG